jgi:hypothetical protein
MTEHEPWLERLIREATEAGEFDDLPGAGEPLADLERPYDPAWWARRWMERESRSEAARAVAAEVRREVPRILAGSSETAMRDRLQAVNDRISAVNGQLAPADRLPFLDVDAMIAGRASRRSS